MGVAVGARPKVPFQPLVQQLLDPPKIRRLPHGAPIPSRETTPPNAA
ncbi:MAG: hypothetical protein IPM75_19075 [Candidatus Competibacteraceae bacterium]|nr:hypothetical protein [Candidatus Competibacteraceae bacterium]